MLNIIKNSFIMFYKYLPILIPLGLIGPVYIHYFPLHPHIPLSLFVLLAIFIILSNIKDLSRFKSWKFWLVYTIAFLIYKYLYLFANTFFTKIIAPEIFLYTEFSKLKLVILVTGTLYYLDFRLTTMLCAVVNGEKFSLKNIYNITNAPYWKIIIFVMITTITVSSYMLIPDNLTLFTLPDIASQWYVGCMANCFAVCFYKAKKEGRI